MDPIANMLTTIENAHRAKIAIVTIPRSAVKVAILAILKETGRIKDYRFSDGRHPEVKITLSDQFYKFRRVSKPSKRFYMTYSRLPATRAHQLMIVSTSQGMMTSHQAKKKRLGGELIARIN